MSCETPPPRVGPLGDVANGPKLARDAADVLLRFSAYDYALAGSLSGEKARVVSAERYATVAREGVRDIGLVTNAAIATTADARGPVRDHLVPLADGLAQLGKDATVYADGADPAAFAHVIDDVAAGWQQLAVLASFLPRDDALARTIARGTSFTSSARAERQYALTVGGFTSAAEADAAAKRIGTVQSVTKSSPFVIRVGTYPDRAAADASAAALASKGVTTSLVTEEARYVFARSGPLPDAELWREPVRIFDTRDAARRVAVSSDGAWVATGGDDGVVAIFSGAGILRALPRFVAGVSQLAFSDDARWLMAGGTTLATLSVPDGVSYGTPVRLPSAVTQVVFVPTARAFAAVSKGPTGLPAGGGGSIAARAPDGVVLGQPFPFTTPAAGGALATTDAGELFIATTSGGGTDVEAIRVGLERFQRGVVRIPGTQRLLAVDRTGQRGALVTDQGTYRFGPHDPDPAKTLRRVGAPVREIAFTADGTLLTLEQDRLVAYDDALAQRWTLALVDGRRLVAASRALVVDGPDRLLAVAADGSAEELGSAGAVQDIAASLDGKRVVALVEGRRALLFSLP